jgi:K+-sensing histidine kinase KdpD
LRVIKGNTARYVSFYKSVPSIQKQGTNNYKPAEDTLTEEQNDNEVLSEILRFTALLNTADTVQKIKHLVENSIRTRLNFTETDFFLFENNNTVLASPGNTSGEESTRFINNAYKEGILDWAFSTKTPRTIPVYGSYSYRETPGSCMVIPLFEGAAPKGVFSIMYETAPESESDELYFLQVIVSYAFQKVSLLIKNEETKSAYNSLQVYQSKLSNDYRLFAVGELAGGVLEEILDPLQVIYTSVDLLHVNNGNKEIIESIKNQVRKIESSAERLIKFADRSGYASRKVYPSNLNKIIENYYAIISSSLEKKQIECILDLEPDLPSILTNSDLINQMLVNIFSIITADFTRPGGILLQTQHVKDIVKLSVITTEVITALDEASSDPNYKIILQLVCKHEGWIETNANDKFGTKIDIKFPLKRKIRA